METRCGGGRRTKIVLYVLICTIFFIVGGDTAFASSLGVPTQLDNMIGIIGGNWDNVVDGREDSFISLKNNASTWHTADLCIWNIGSDGFRSLDILWGDGDFVNSAARVWVLISSGGVIQQTEAAKNSWTSIPIDENKTIDYIKLRVQWYNIQTSIRIYEVSADMGPDLIPPTVPTGLNATLDVLKAHLSWQANSEPDLAGYKVYRNGNLLVETSETNFTDTSLDLGMVYEYTITAYDTNGNESAHSEPVIIVTPPKKPVVSTRVDNRNIILSWTGGDGADLYKIKVNGSQFITYEKEYIYDSADPGEYVIQVIAVNSAGETLSDTITVKVSSIPSPGALVIAKNLLHNMTLVLYSFGGLLAFALALNASPTLISITKAFMRRFF